MTILTYILTGLTGIAGMFLFLNVYIMLRNRQSNYLGFVLLGLAAVIYIPCNIILYQVQTPAEYLRVLTVQMYGTALYMLGLFVMYASYMQFSLRWPLTVYGLGFAFFLTARTINPMFNYAQFSGMTDYTTLWGETLRVPVTSLGPWGYLYLVFLVSAFFSLFTLVTYQARRGAGQHVGLLYASLGIFFFTFVHDIVVVGMALPWFFLSEIGLVIVVAIMELAVADDAIRAQSLSRELNEMNARLEQRVEERTAALESALRELEDFSYSVSHDLRTPLRGVNGYARILRDDFGDILPLEALSHLDQINSSASRMAQLIDELLAFSRIGRGELHKQVVDVNALVATVVGSLRPQTQGRQVLWEISTLPPALGDPMLLHIVFANLLENAIKYTQGRAPARIEVASSELDGRVTYFVRDNGVGFDMQYADKLFGIFQRLHHHDEFEGTGIGLATVQRIIQRHGGRIWAESALGAGATFYFTLD